MLELIHSQRTCRVCLSKQVLEILDGSLDILSSKWSKQKCLSYLKVFNGLTDFDETLERLCRLDFCHWIKP